MGKQLTLKEYNEINQLRKEGMKIADIAIVSGKAQSTICEIIKQGGRVKFKKDGQPIIVDKGLEYCPIDELDLSSLPDTVLFKHDNSFIF